MRRPKILTLTTDFGADGPYVAAMKGVVLGLVRDVQLVDVSHAIGPQDILGGAFVLSEVVEAFPEGTVHLAVIDPGVGTDRKLIAVSAFGQWFVLPDNGLISGVVRDRPPDQVREIANPALRLPRVSSTFHGRDVLAPAAAHLLDGGDPSELGPERASIVAIGQFRPRECPEGLIGEVIFRDTFGNLITNVSADRLPEAPASDWTIELAGERISGLSRTYGDHASGALVAVVGSSGWIEVAVVNGDAGRHLSAGPGETVWIKRSR